MIILSGAIILTINNVRIIPQAENVVDETNLEEVQTIASLIWSDAFVDPNIEKTQEGLETAVLTGLQKEGIDTAKYIVSVNDEGVKVTVQAVEQAPEKWQANVTMLVDSVPIPKGFVASGATGENTKDGGLVIYEGTTPVTDANVETAKRTRNQYVWVPVDDFSDFKRQNFSTSDTISNKIANNCWEVELDLTTNMPLPTQKLTYMTTKTLTEVQAMYESVKEYKGFYIARYESGIDRQRTNDNYIDKDGNIILETNVYSMMGKIPYTHIMWTKNNSMNEDTNGAVEAARSIYQETNANYGVVSTLTYGVQWDVTLQWWLDTNTEISLNGSTSHGNYLNHVIESGDLNEGAKYSIGDNGSYQEVTSNSTKAKGTSWALTTGALKAANINNIYDMLGNMFEWTMEGGSTTYRIFRGGAFFSTGNSNPAIRGYIDPNDGVAFSFGFRPALYIKK